MDILNLIAKSSLSVMTIKPKTVEPTGFGSGCIAAYKSVLFFLTVAHVTDFDGEQACISTYNFHDKGQDIFCLGALRYYDLYNTPKNLKPENVTSAEELLGDFDKTLDITFCKVPLPITIKLLQPEWDFKAYKIDAGEKVFLNLDKSTNPEKGKLYGFCGSINQKIVGKTIHGEPSLKLDLEYVNTVGYFHVFRAPEIIKSKEEYEGTSGAPILDEQGLLVGLASSVRVNSLLIYAFSIERCKFLLDIELAQVD